MEIKTVGRGAPPAGAAVRTLFEPEERSEVCLGTPGEVSARVPPAPPELRRTGARFAAPKPRPPSPGAEINPCLACNVRHLAVCSVLSPRELDELRGFMTTVELPGRRTVIYEGDPADHLFIVSAGAVKLYKLLADGRRQITGFLYPGDFLGLAHNQSYAYSAETIGRVTLCRFLRRRFETMMEAHPAMEKRLLTMASNELVNVQEQMLLLGRKSAREKLTSFLLSLSRRAAGRGQPDNPVELPMCRADIADFLGLTTETVSRTFTALKTTGVIRLLSNERVELQDPNCLRDLSEGR
jgi:CRP/FNR family transcriptional regulator